jgi:sulfatase maturation enzyme AslB (radical SAM superfamily)
MKKCAAFWKHTNLRNSDKIFPCCRFKQPVGVFDGNVSEILHSDVYNKLRLTDVSTLPACAKCMYEEDNGKKSLREKFNETYDTETIGLEYLEVGLDNICNLTCDGCWAEFSSSWSEKQFPDKPKSFHIRSGKDIEVLPDTLNKILFLGGEPLMTTRHYKILQKIKTPENVEVTYNTNATFMLSEQHISLLNTFKKVHFIVSIDAYGELNDKVRSGSKWSQILEFIDQIKSTKFSMSINSVLHINNWRGFIDLENFVNEVNVDWEVNVLTFPKHLDVANNNNKKEVLDLIRKTNIPNKEYVINHLS